MKLCFIFFIKNLGTQDHRMIIVEKQITHLKIVFILNKVSFKNNIRQQVKHNVAIIIIY